MLTGLENAAMVVISIVFRTGIIFIENVTAELKDVHSSMTNMSTN